MLNKIAATILLFFFSLGLGYSQKSTFIGLHFSENRDEFKFLDSGNSLSSFPLGSRELGLKIRKRLKNNFSLDTGIKHKRFHHPTGALNEYVQADNFLLPVEINYRLAVNKKYKIYLTPALGTYFGFNPFQQKHHRGTGVSNPNPFIDDRFSFQYESEISQNWAGGRAGVSLEFTIFKESFLKIGYYQTSSFFRIYENETRYTRNGTDFDFGLISSRGHYQSILVDFFFPLP